MPTYISKLFSIDPKKLQKPKLPKRYSRLSEEVKKLIMMTHPLELIMKIYRIYKKKIMGFFEEKGRKLSEKEKELLIEVITAILNDETLLSEAVVRDALSEIHGINL